MVLANTPAGQTWHKLMNAECLTNNTPIYSKGVNETSNPISQLVDVSEQLNRFDQNEAVYVNKDGKPLMYVADIINTLNKRLARHQSLALMSGAA